MLRNSCCAIPLGAGEFLPDARVATSESGLAKSPCRGLATRTLHRCRPRFGTGFFPSRNERASGRVNVSVSPGVLRLADRGPSVRFSWHSGSSIRSTHRVPGLTAKIGVPSLSRVWPMSEAAFFDAQLEPRKSTNACNYSYVSTEVRWNRQRLDDPANRPKNRRSQQNTWPQ